MSKRSCRRGDHNWHKSVYRASVALPGYAGDMYLAVCSDCDAIKCEGVSMTSTNGGDTE